MGQIPTEIIKIHSLDNTKGNFNFSVGIPFSRFFKKKKKYNNILVLQHKPTWIVHQLWEIFNSTKGTPSGRFLQGEHNTTKAIKIRQKWTEKNLTTPKRSEKDKNFQKWKDNPSGKRTKSIIGLSPFLEENKETGIFALFTVILHFFQHIFPNPNLTLHFLTYYVFVVIIIINSFIQYITVLFFNIRYHMNSANDSTKMSNKNSTQISAVNSAK